MSDTITLDELTKNIEAFALKMGVIEEGYQAASLVLVARFEAVEDYTEVYRVIPLTATTTWAERYGLMSFARKRILEIMTRQEQA